MLLNVYHSVYLKYKEWFCWIIYGLVSREFECVPWTFMDLKVGCQSGIVKRR